MNARGKTRQIVAAVALAAFVASSTHGLAQEHTACTMANFELCLPPDVTPDELADLIAAARAAIDLGDWAAALETLDAAVAIVPLGVTQVARANALWQLGRDDEALALCTEMLDDVDPVAVERAGALRSLIEAGIARAATPEPPAEASVTSEEGSEPAPSAVVEDPLPALEPAPGLIAEPAPEPGRATARTAVLWTSSTLAVGFGAAAVILGTQSNRLEDDVRTYDRAAADASIAELNGLERDASRASSQANACFAVAAFAGGAVVGLVLERWLGR